MPACCRAISLALLSPMEEAAERCAWFWEAAAFAAIVGTSRALVINTAAVQAARGFATIFFIMFLSSVKLFFSNFQGVFAVH